MAKFIERDKAVELIFLVATTGRTTEALKLLRKESVEANPVVHAKWIEDESAFVACNHCMHELKYPEYKTPYCPHCGARMDGEDKTMVHAYWRGIEGDGYDLYGNIIWDTFECSNCGKEHHANGEPEWDYCPSCGAKMDGEDEE